MTAATMAQVPSAQVPTQHQQQLPTRSTTPVIASRKMEFNKMNTASMGALSRGGISQTSHQLQHDNSSRKRLDVVLHKHPLHKKSED